MERENAEKQERERGAETRGTVLVEEAEEENPNLVLRESSALGTRKKRIRGGRGQRRCQCCREGR